MKLEDEELIDFLLDDFKKRDLSNCTNFLYNAFWYGIANDDECRYILINKLKNENYSYFKNYLFSLNKNSNLIGELNIKFIQNQLK